MSLSIGAAEPVTAGPVWTVAAVADRLGVAASTLRSWSLRYGIGPPGHPPGRHRRYTADDVSELDTMLRMMEQGMALPAAAALVRGRRHGGQPAGESAAPGGTGPVPPGTVRDVVAAARDLDPVTASSIITASLNRYGVVTTWNEVCRVALVALDAPGPDRPAVTRARHGLTGCIEGELALSQAVATSLHRLPTPPAPRGARRALLACAEGEQHTLGLHVLCAALAEQSVDARMLGAAVDHRVLSAAVASLDPDVVVVWAQVPATAVAAGMSALATGTALVVAAGPGWARTGLDPSVRRAVSLQDALTTIGC